MEQADQSSYQHREWKVEPSSIFDYDPVEQGIESVSLGYLHNDGNKTVYEGYGKKDLYAMCGVKVKGVDAKPAIAWVHGGQTRASNVARLAEATSTFQQTDRITAESPLASSHSKRVESSSLRINGVPIDVEELMTKCHVDYSFLKKSAKDQKRGQQTLRHEERYVMNDVQKQPDFVEMPPSLPPINITQVYAPKPYEPNESFKVEQPLYKNFNRTAKPFSRTILHQS